jgi:hypothetical protein
MAPKNEVNINVGEIYISIATEHDYPDVISDLIARARELTRNVLGDMKTLGVDLEDIVENISYGSDFDDGNDEEEDA